jgi:hypothetical protein
MADIHVKVDVHYEDLDAFEYIVKSILNKLGLEYSALIPISSPFKVSIEGEDFSIKSTKVSLDGYVTISMRITSNLFYHIKDVLKK